MTNDNLEKVEKALDKIRDSFLFPRPELSSNLGKDATRSILDISYSLLYLAKEQQSEINDLLQKLEAKQNQDQTKELTDNTPVVIMVDNQYYLEGIANTVGIYGLLQDPKETGIYGYYSYSVAKKVLEATPVEDLLDSHEVEIITLDELKEKLKCSWNFYELGLYQ